MRKTNSTVTALIIAVVLVLVVGAATVLGTRQTERKATAEEMGIPPNVPTLTPELVGAPGDTRPVTQIWKTSDEAANNAISIVKSSPDMFQLEDPKAMSGVTLGTPYTVYSLDREKFATSSDDSSIGQYLVKDNGFVYPLLIQGNPIGELQVGPKDGGWEFTGFHGNQSATALLYMQKELGTSAESLKFVMAGQSAALAVTGEGSDEHVFVVYAVFDDLAKLDQIYSGSMGIIDPAKVKLTPYKASDILPTIRKIQREQESSWADTMITATAYAKDRLLTPTPKTTTP